MRADEVYKIFRDFFKNDFIHLRSRVDRIYYIVIGALISAVGALIAIIVQIIIGG